MRFNVWLILLSLLNFGYNKAASTISVTGGSVAVTYQLDNSWGTGYQAQITLKNNSSTTLQNWQLNFTLPNQITQCWNATLISSINNVYTFGPPNWQKSLAPGASANFGFLVTGSSLILPTNYSLNGSSGGNGGTTPPTPPATVAPAKPTVSVQYATSNSYNVIWTIYYGSKATSWSVYENDKLIYSSSIASTDTTNTQSAMYTISGNTFGIFNYKVVVTNSAGSTTSDTVSYLVGGASKIIISPSDNTQQQLQITVGIGSNSLDLSTLGVTNASYSVKTNNSSVIVPSVTGNKLNINALKSGRASLYIKENNSGQERYVGVRVKTSDGKIPGLPNYVSLGTVSDDTAANLTFLQSFDQGLLSKKTDIRYIYINGGPFNGWRTWSGVDGGRAINYIQNSKKLGFIPFFVYYNIPDSEEGYLVDNGHIQDEYYMQAYFKDLKFFLDIVRTYGGDEMVGIVIEPDFLGYMMQNAGAAASQITAYTSAAYSSGVLSSTDPVFANNVQGLVQAINYTISKYAPNAYFGWQFNIWASPGVTTGVPSNGLMHITDTAGITKGRASIVSEAQAIANYYINAGVKSYGAKFISIDKYGLDAGFTSPQSPAQSPWFWNADHWNNYLLFSKTLGTSTQLPVILWQLPVGRINTSLEKNPYNNNAQFPVLNNTVQRYEDSAPTFFLGDSFNPGTTTRINYFATNNGGDSKISKSGSTVTWQPHMLDAKNNGIIAILFGAGVAESTTNIGNPPTDSYWWITKAQKYLASPVPLS